MLSTHQRLCTRSTATEYPSGDKGCPSPRAAAGGGGAESRRIFGVGRCVCVGVLRLLGLQASAHLPALNPRDVQLLFRGPSLHLHTHHTHPSTLTHALAHASLRAAPPTCRVAAAGAGLPGCRSQHGHRSGGWTSPRCSLGLGGELLSRRRAGWGWSLGAGAWTPGLRSVPPSF